MMLRHLKKIALLKPQHLAAVVIGLLLGCVYPTERSEELRVVLDAVPELLRGELHRLTGHVVDAEGNPVALAEVSFASGDPLVAIVDTGGTMLAVSVGSTEIVATSVEFALAQPASQIIRIHDLIEIDSMGPAVVMFGDMLQIYGTGLNPERLFAVSVGGIEAPIMSYTPADPSEPNRFGVLQVWTMPPAPPFSEAFALSVDGLAASPDSVRVLQRDIYEPNDTIPWDFGSLGSTIHNPALAFERRSRDDSLRFDWYRFTQSTISDWTIAIRSDALGPEAYQVFFTDSLRWWAGGFQLGAQSFTIGPSLYVCNGIPFGPPQFPADSVVISLRDLPLGAYDLLVAYDRQGWYEMSIVPGYVSALPPDAAEENDFCNVAAALAIGTSGSFTIDNPHDIDWFRFNVPAAGLSYTFDLISDDADADLDIYVLQDFTPDSLILRGLSNIGGFVDAVTVPLDGGNYFAVVVDFAGVPTNYTLTTSSLVAPPGAVAEPQMMDLNTGKPAPIFTLPKPLR